MYAREGDEGVCVCVLVYAPVGLVHVDPPARRAAARRSVSDRVDLNSNLREFEIQIQIQLCTYLFMVLRVGACRTV